MFNFRYFTTDMCNDSSVAIATSADHANASNVVTQTRIDGNSVIIFVSCIGDDQHRVVQIAITCKKRCKDGAMYA